MKVMQKRYILECDNILHVIRTERGSALAAHIFAYLHRRELSLNQAITNPPELAPQFLGETWQATVGRGWTGP